MPELSECMNIFFYLLFSLKQISSLQHVEYKNKNAIIMQTNSTEIKSKEKKNPKNTHLKELFLRYYSMISSRFVNGWGV